MVGSNLNKQPGYLVLVQEGRGVLPDPLAEGLELLRQARENVDVAAVERVAKAVYRQEPLALRHAGGVGLEVSRATGVLQKLRESRQTLQIWTYLTVNFSSQADKYSTM